MKGIKTQVNSRGIYSYNTSFIFKGNDIEIKRYSEEQLKGYTKASKDKKNLLQGDFENVKLNEYERNSRREINLDNINKIVSDAFDRRNENEKNKKENFEKSNYRARQNIIELVACNHGTWKDARGKKQLTKFITLTFKDDVTDIKKANSELTKFMKRLSYFLYRVKKNVLKYIAIPELQKRGVWHFHLIIFNMEYINHKDLMKLWDNGLVGINAIDNKQGGYDSARKVAFYVAKYVTKGTKVNKKGEVDLGNDEKVISYKKYKKLGLENFKRYSASRGLKRADRFDVELTQKEFVDIFNFITENTDLIDINKKGDKIKSKTYKTDYRGDVEYINMATSKRNIIYIKAIIRTIAFSKIPIKKETINFKSIMTLPYWEFIDKLKAYAT